jgi:hypothetical protein
MSLGREDDEDEGIRVSGSGDGARKTPKTPRDRDYYDHDPEDYDDISWGE